MQAVAALCYAPVTYPYFFKDLDGNKQCSAAEKVATNGFSAFTPALMKASFNYQFSRKEPGAWAHNFDYYSGSGCRRIAAGSGMVGVAPTVQCSTDPRQRRKLPLSREPRKRSRHLLEDVARCILSSADLLPRPRNRSCRALLHT
jgi:hypothetical protein